LLGVFLLSIILVAGITVLIARVVQSKKTSGGFDVPDRNGKSKRAKKVKLKKAKPIKNNKKNKPVKSVKSAKTSEVGQSDIENDYRSGIVPIDHAGIVPLEIEDPIIITGSRWITEPVAPAQQAPMPPVKPSAPRPQGAGPFAIPTDGDEW
jgi:hypothetical protein